jgi:hypothetical protein
MRRTLKLAIPYFSFATLVTLYCPWMFIHDGQRYFLGYAWIWNHLQIGRFSEQVTRTAMVDYNVLATEHLALLLFFGLASLISMAVSTEVPRLCQREVP